MCDFEDWETTNTPFKYLNRLLGPLAIDRFTDNKNAKPKFLIQNTGAQTRLV